MTTPAVAPSLTPDTRPRLPRGVRLIHNEAQGGWVLLAPERVFKADPIAAEVVKRCTGEATFAAIVDDLATTFGAPRERVLADVTAMLHGLADKKLLEFDNADTQDAGTFAPMTEDLPPNAHAGLTWSRRQAAARPARPPGRADAPLSAGLPVLLQSGRARRPR